MIIKVKQHGCFRNPDSTPLRLLCQRPSGVDQPRVVRARTAATSRLRHAAVTVARYSGTTMNDFSTGGAGLGADPRERWRVLGPSISLRHRAREFPGLRSTVPVIRKAALLPLGMQRIIKYRCARLPVGVQQLTQTQPQTAFSAWIFQWVLVSRNSPTRTETQCGTRGFTE
jgi:hypothetical protein